MKTCRGRSLLKVALLSVSGLLLTSEFSYPQVSFPPCQPPAANEYLLLVVSQTQENQAQVRKVLPANSTAIVCDYQSTIVTRVSGFTNQEIANSWAKYMTDMVKLPAFVARPAATVATNSVSASEVATPASPAAKPEPQAATKPAASATKPATATAKPATATAKPSGTARSTTNSKPANSPAAKPSTPNPGPVAFNPQVLGTGYAVIVDYQNKPELALQVRKVTGRDVGLVSYEQRPYLLANYTPNQGTASATFKALSDRGLKALIVDSRKVVLLRSAVSAL